MDVLIPYHATKGGDELRYTLRSIEKYLKHDRVIIVGGRHEWFSDEIMYIPKLQYIHKFWDAESNIRKGLKVVSDQFYFFNDDMILLDRVDTIPNYYIGTLAECLDNRIWRHGKSSYTVAIKNTMTWLEKRGVKTQYNYSAHIPMVMDRKLRKEISDEIMPVLSSGQQLLARAIYGNVAGLEGAEIKDVKIYDAHAPIPDNLKFISTNEKSFQDGLAGRGIKSRFPDPSKYER